ncbi:asparagine synthase-related protein [Rhizobacter fulvus]
MPGLAAIFSRHPDAARQLEQMLGAFSHDADQVRGTHSDGPAGVHAGWALHRGGFADCLPVWNGSHDVVLLFTGELFTAPEHLAALGRGGHPVDATKASHIMQLYEEHGDGFLECLNGSFCGLLVDRRRGLSMLFNDRYGAGRLYLHETPDGLYAASEAKGLLRLFPRTRCLDAAAVAETFSLGCVVQDRTLFEGITLLPPGSFWTIAADGNIDRRRHFEPSRLEQREPLPDADFHEALRDTFATILPSYLRPGADDSRPAMSLTGGLDSRMIMAWANAAPGALPCYSFGGPYRDCHDVMLGRRIAALTSQDHHTLPADAQMLDRFPELAEDCIEASDGTMDVSGAVEVHVNRLARAISPIRITGNYGSEIVRGNVAFRPRRLDRTLLESSLAGLVDRAEAHYRAERAVSDLSFVAFKQVPWHHHARLAVEQSILTVRSPFLDNRLVDLMFRASPVMRASREPSLQLIHAGSPALAALPTDRGLTCGPTAWTDRLRHALREFSVRAEYAYDYGMPAPLVSIDSALSSLQLERLFLGRHKFYHFRAWYRGPLAGYLRDMLLDSGARASRWFAPGVLHAMVEAHTCGRANHTLDLHRALTLELVERRLLEAAAHPREPSS